MLRIHFTVEDIARLRLTAGLNPMMEGAFALHLFRRSENLALHKWRTRVRAELGDRADEFVRAGAQRTPRASA